MHLGDFALETTIHCKFTTRSFTTGAPTQLAGTPAVEIYEDNSTTQITAAETLTVDFDSITGLNHLAIVATAANGFESGKFYQAVISAGTVGGVSVVGEVVASFTVQATAALRPTTAGRTLDVSAGGEAGVDWANVGSPTTTVGLSGTTVKTATDVETDTADIQSRLPAALVSGRIDASVGAMAANVLTATAINADAITAAKVAADVHAEAADAVWDEDATGHQTGGTFGQAIGDPGASTETLFKAIITDPAGTNIAADIIALKAETAAILDDTDLIDDGTSGLAKIATDVAAILVDTGTTLQGELDGIQADTEDIQSRLPAALVSGRIDASVGAMAANVMTAAAAAADLTTELQNGLATAAALDTVDNLLDTEVAAIKTVVDAIQAKTDNLPSDPADASVIAGRFDTLDTSVADLPTNAELATSQAAADDATLAAIAALSIPTVSEILTTTMTESYAANGAQMTLAQALYAIQQTVQMFAIAGTSKTVKKLNNSDTAFIITHDSATAPTSAART